MSDFNADGRTDAYLVHNLFSTRREIGRWDGGVSTLLLGAVSNDSLSLRERAGVRENRQTARHPHPALSQRERVEPFIAVPPRESGLLVPEDAKSTVISDITGDGWPDIVLGVNDGKPIAFEHQGVPKHRIVSVRLKGKPGNPTAVGACVTLVRSDGLRQTAEVTAGGGSLSQQSPILWFGLGTTSHAASIEIRWPDGTSSRHVPKAGELACDVTVPTN
jgi:enediyne biosynthesis protein E4